MKHYAGLDISAKETAICIVLKDLEPVEPVRRYEWGYPGKMVHCGVRLG
ncbi:hypothetical protein SAMN03080618_03519 [Aquamicrobium aerolatum DSM 21857]|uniref:Uncharacterized protein n=1 Tax=Aquamicrobium aerolatum DSM 21857 TaxID=1121003 RepID=A0A1I3SY82_9HYPH|nr:hypothetical protein SAMN03080618_03519 [Aquamicrobium aerolatum DSM 21857]